MALGSKVEEHSLHDDASHGKDKMSGDTLVSGLEMAYSMIFLLVISDLFLTVFLL